MDVNQFMVVTFLSEASPQGDPLCLPLLTTQANMKQPQLRTRSKSPATGYGGNASKHLANNAFFISWLLNCGDGP